MVLYIFYYLLLFLNVWMTILRKRSNLILAGTYILLFILFFSNDASGHDHYLYKIVFEHPDEKVNLEFLFNYLQDFIRWIGITDYNVFLALLFLLCSSFMLMGITYYTKFLHPIAALCLTFVFPQWAVAIRFFLAISIAFLSTRFLLKGRWVTFIFLIFCSASIHYSLSALIILLPFFTPKMLRKYDRGDFDGNILSYSILAVFLLSICIYFFAENVVYDLAFSTIGGVIGKAALSDVDNKVSAYFEAKTRFGFLIFTVIYAVNLYMAIVLKKRMMRKNTSEEIRRILYSGTIINKILAIFIPLVIINLVFGRVLAFGSVINLAIMGAVIEKVKPLTREDFSFLIKCFIVVILSWSVPAILEINSISPNGLIREVIQFWG